jgi:predicted RNA binding protein YcfA (HicA-like mRNA interferase family)
MAYRFAERLSHAVCTSDKKGRVTIPFHGKGKDMTHQMVKSILTQAGLD